MRLLADETADAAFGDVKVSTGVVEALGAIRRLDCVTTKPKYKRKQ